MDHQITEAPQSHKVQLNDTNLQRFPHDPKCINNRNTDNNYNYATVNISSTFCVFVLFTLINNHQTRLMIKFTWLMAQTAGTFKSNRIWWMQSLSCLLDALAFSVPVYLIKQTSYMDDNLPQRKALQSLNSGN